MMEVSEVMVQSGCCHGALRDRQTHQTAKRFKATIKPGPFEERDENPLESDRVGQSPVLVLDIIKASNNLSPRSSPQLRSKNRRPRERETVVRDNEESRLRRSN